MSPTTLIARRAARRASAGIDQRVEDLSAALGESEARYQQALAAADLGTWDFDVTSGLVRMDVRARGVFGFEAEWVTAAEIVARVHPEDVDAFSAARQAALDPDQPDAFTQTLRVRQPDGRTLWARVHARVLFETRMGARTPVRGVGIVSDVTERVQAERALRRSEAHLRRVIDSQISYVAILEPDGTVLDVNQSGLEIGALSREDVVGRPFWECAWWSYDPAVSEEIKTAVRRGAAGERVRADIRAWAAPDERIIVDFQLVPAYDEDGTLAYLLPSGVDVTERRHAEAELRRLNESLEARVTDRTRQVDQLSRALALAEQEERRRIAYVLHEDLQQVLAAARTMADLDDADRVRALLDHSLRITRSLAHDFAPPLLENGDFPSVLAWLAQRSWERHGLRVQLDIAPPLDVPDASLRALLFQLLREVLFNVAKHSGVMEARIGATHHADVLRLDVRDEGAGFEPASAGKKGGLGLASVRQRLGHIGGTLAIDSAPGAGTCVTFEVPTG